MRMTIWCVYMIHTLLSIPVKHFVTLPKTNFFTILHETNKEWFYTEENEFVFDNFGLDELDR